MTQVLWLKQVSHIDMRWITHGMSVPHPAGATITAVCSYSESDYVVVLSGAIKNCTNNMFVKECFTRWQELA